MTITCWADEPRYGFQSEANRDAIEMEREDRQEDDADDTDYLNWLEAQLTDEEKRQFSTPQTSTFDPALDALPFD